MTIFKFDTKYQYTCDFLNVNSFLEFKQCVHIQKIASVCWWKVCCDVLSFKFSFDTIFWQCKYFNLEKRCFEMEMQ